MSELQWVGVGMIALGVFLLSGVTFQWRWFVNGRKYGRMVEAFGETAPRILYGLLGLVLLVFGILGAAGIWRGGFDFGPR